MPPKSSSKPAIGASLRKTFSLCICDHYLLRHVGDIVAIGSNRASSARATDDQCSISGDCATSPSLSVPNSCRLSQRLILQAERQCLFPFRQGDPETSAQSFAR